MPREAGWAHGAVQEIARKRTEGCRAVAWTQAQRGPLRLCLRPAGHRRDQGSIIKIEETMVVVMMVGGGCPQTPLLSTYVRKEKGLVEPLSPHTCPFYRALLAVLKTLWWGGGVPGPPSLPSSSSAGRDGGGLVGPPTCPSYRPPPPLAGRNVLTLVPVPDLKNGKLPDPPDHASPGHKVLLSFSRKELEPLELLNLRGWWVLGFPDFWGGGFVITCLSISHPSTVAEGPFGTEGIRPKGSTLLYLAGLQGKPHLTNNGPVTIHLDCLDCLDCNFDPPAHCSDPVRFSRQEKG